MVHDCSAGGRPIDQATDWLNNVVHRLEAPVIQGSI